MCIGLFISWCVLPAGFERTHPLTRRGTGALRGRIGWHVVNVAAGKTARTEERGLDYLGATPAKAMSASERAIAECIVYPVGGRCAAVG